MNGTNIPFCYDLDYSSRTSIRYLSCAHTHILGSPISWAFHRMETVQIWMGLIGNGRAENLSMIHAYDFLTARLCRAFRSQHISVGTWYGVRFYSPLEHVFYMEKRRIGITLRGL